MEEGWEALPIGCGEVLREGKDVLIVAYGAMVPKAVATAKCLSAVGVEASVINARYLRPLDEALIHPMAERIGKLVTMEEGALPGGFGSAVLESIQEKGLAIPMLRIGIPDQLVDHATPQQSFEALGLTPDQMALRIKEHFVLETTGSLKLEQKSPAEVPSAG
jgi:1-deoxy-D-xylulose-5-phosphate synthase